MPSRANIDKASWSVSLSRGAIFSRSFASWSDDRLIPGRAQTGNAVPVHVALPRQELLDRELVGLADRIERHPAAADGLDDRALRRTVHRLFDGAGSDEAPEP